MSGSIHHNRKCYSPRCMKWYTMRIQRKAGRHTLTLHSIEIGEDLLVTIYGGDEHHIGGISMAYHTQSHYRDAQTVSVNTLTFPGHKDYIVSNDVAEKLCKAIEKQVVVTVGIHMDKATMDEIDKAVSTVNEMVEELVQTYQKAE